MQSPAAPRLRFWVRLDRVEPWHPSCKHGAATLRVLFSATGPVGRLVEGAVLADYLQLEADLCCHLPGRLAFLVALE